MVCMLRDGWQYPELDLEVIALDFNNRWANEICAYVSPHRGRVHLRS